MHNNRLPAQRIFPRAILWIISMMIAPLYGDVIINEISPIDNRLELLNAGSSSVDVSNWWLCTQIRYARISDTSRVTVESGNLNLGAGEFLVLETTSAYDINDEAADMGLYNSNAFTSTTAMQDFVQWGSGNNGRIAVASAKGIWTSGSFAPAPGAGQSLIFDGQTTGADGWSLTDNPSFGSANDAGAGAGGGIVPAETAEIFFNLAFRDTGSEGWWVEPSLGAVYVSSYPWIFHPKLGWFYVHGPSSDSDFFTYLPGLGWQFTRVNDVFPYFWDVVGMKWLYFGEDFSTANERFFFDFALQDWFSPDPS